MQDQKLHFSKKTRRVCYWDSEKMFVNTSKAAFEEQLKNIGSFTFDQLNRLDDPKLLPCDLLVIPSFTLDEQETFRWLKGLHTRIKSQNGIWIPAIIITDAKIEDWSALIQWATELNWYFDIIHPDHFHSLPTRVANLLRIHDHLHELLRYDKTLQELDEKVSWMKKKIYDNS